MEAAGRPLGTWMAAGCVARYWTPDRPSRRDVERLLAGDAPSCRALAWAASRPRGEIKTVEAAARSAALLIAERLAGFRPSKPPGRRAARACVDAAMRRDDLECVAVLLRGAGAGAELASALRSLDAAARSKALAMPRGPWPSSVRQRFLFQIDPQAWWSRVLNRRAGVAVRQPRPRSSSVRTPAKERR